MNLPTATFRGRLTVWVDEPCASACEYAANWAKDLDRTTLGGTNTAGANTFGDPGPVQLPNSKVISTLWPDVCSYSRMHKPPHTRLSKKKIVKPESDRVLDQELRRFVQLLVVNCVRNTALEGIHSGVKLDNKRMRLLMKEISNKVYTFLKYQEDRNFMGLMHMYYPDDWDNPKLDKSFMRALSLLQPGLPKLD